MKRICNLTVLFIFFFSASCGPLVPVTPQRHSIPIPKGTLDPRITTAAESVDSALVEANTSFAFDLFRMIVSEKTDQNIVLSPVSISMALHMLYNGADGQTQEAMGKGFENPAFPFRPPESGE
jgi:serine protease inhibitor